MTPRPVVRVFTAVPVAVAVLALSASVAGAAPPNPSWTCNAHAVTANGGGSGGATLDPLHANVDPNAPCRDDGAAVPAVAARDILGANTVSAASGSAQAQTGVTNAGAPVFSQAPAAVAQLDNSDVSLGGGSLHVTARGVRSYVAARCQGTSPAFGSEGQVVDLKINGTPIPASGQPDQAFDQAFTGLSPLAPIVHVQTNLVRHTGTATSGDETLTREAVRIELLTAPGAAPAFTVVLGSATVDRHGDVCAGNPPGNPPVNPPWFPPGSNEPGSNGGVVFVVQTAAAASGPSTATGTGGGPGSTGGVLGSMVNGLNGSECARMRVYWDTQRGTHGRPSGRGPKALRARYGLRHVIRGVVRNCRNKPIVFGRIDVYNIVKGKRHLLKTGLRTRRGGKLTMITPMNYNTRTIEFTYRGLINRPKVASRQKLRITTFGHGGSRLTA